MYDVRFATDSCKINTHLAIGIKNSRIASFLPTSLSLRKALIMRSISLFLFSLTFSPPFPSSSIRSESASFEVFISPMLTRRARL